MKLRSLVFAGVLLFASVANAPNSFAHAALEKTVPVKGSIVAASTNKVTLYFGEDILVLKGKNPNSISVTNSKGMSISLSETKVSGTKVSEALKTPLESGKYKVSYRVVSADGHVVSGSYSFNVK